MKRIFLVSGLIATLFLSCATGPDPRRDPFTRASLLIDAIDKDIREDNLSSVVNRLNFGLEKDFLSPSEAQEYLQEYADYMGEMYRRAYRDGDFEQALTAQWNLSVLERNSDFFEVSVQTDSVLSRDQLLLEWAEVLREKDEQVLALYRLLRRSHLEDLSQETLSDYIQIARRYNHDEALRRFTRIAERMNLLVPQPESVLAAPGDEPAVMLPGTVTVWVNKGIRIEQGVGYPDRVIGSGFFVDPRGYLLTNYHVIESEVDPTYEGYSRLFVKLPGRADERVPARVVGYDRIFDLALVKVEIDPQYVFSLSDTRELSPGERVYALGSPGGLDSTITSGIVSAGGRRFLQIGDAIQVDVPINPGNSGGPLVLPEGQVAGVVFAGLEQFEGVNFVIPSYWIRHFFPKLFEQNEVVHPWLGMSVRESSEGLTVIYVTPDSPAEASGVEVGDVLVQIDGEPVRKISRAQDHILKADVDYVLDTLWRVSGNDPSADSGVSHRRRFIALGRRPFSPVENALEREPIEALFPVLFGITVDDVAGAPWGPDYVITEVFPGSVADESSLSVDDPFALRNWRVDTDLRAAFIQIIIKKRKAGFIESGIQLGAYLETNSFL
jgi:serine protease Do